jgi:hypothetical protein
VAFHPSFLQHRGEYGVVLTLRQAITLDTNTTVIPRESGVSSIPQLLDSITTALEYWIIRLRG